MSLDEIPPFFNKNVLVQNLHQKKNLRLDLNELGLFLNQEKYVKINFSKK